MGKWISFIPLGKPENRKTEQWHVVSKERSIALGTIKWFGRFKQYSFEPNPNTVFEKICLRDIADFCEDQTNLYNEKKKEDGNV